MLTTIYSSANANAVETPPLHFFFFLSNKFDQTPVLTSDWFITSVPTE